MIKLQVVNPPKAHNSEQFLRPLTPQQVLALKVAIHSLYDSDDENPHQNWTTQFQTLINKRISINLNKKKKQKKLPVDAITTNTRN